MPGDLHAVAGGDEVQLDEVGPGRDGEAVRLQCVLGAGRVRAPCGHGDYCRNRRSLSPVASLLRWKRRPSTT